MSCVSAARELSCSPSTSDASRRQPRRLGCLSFFVPLRWARGAAKGRTPGLGPSASCSGVLPVLGSRRPWRTGRADPTSQRPGAPEAQTQRSQRPGSAGVLAHKLRWIACALACLVLGACQERTASQPVVQGEVRLISLAPAITETLFAIGAGEQTVGVSQYCDRPVHAKALPWWGTALTP